VPIHGEYRHLRYHTRLAEKAGIPRENIFILENGSVLEITDMGASLAGKVQSGRVFIDGKGGGDVEDIVLRDRRRLAHDGIVIVLVGIEKLTKKVISGPDIISRGFVFEEVSQDVINEVRDLMSQTLAEINDDVIGDIGLIKEKLRLTLKKYLRNTMDRKPMIMPIVMEV
jgi:ribonuclease J